MFTIQIAQLNSSLVGLQADFGMQLSALRAEMAKERDRRSAMEVAVARQAERLATVEAELGRERDRRMELEAEVRSLDRIFFVKKGTYRILAIFFSVGTSVVFFFTEVHEDLLMFLKAFF